MCGIAGILHLPGDYPFRSDEINPLLDIIRHRGPDDAGSYAAPGIAMGMRRLSIIDVKGGSQPISNEDNSVRIVGNGEIYNHEELRGVLKSRGHHFRSGSDIETIVHAYEEFGTKCVEHLRGMYAFAVWDTRKESLMIARDRLGIKPLYYYSDKEWLVFGSEIKSLLQWKNVPRQLNPHGAYQHLTRRFSPGPETVFHGIHKLLPGHFMVVENGHLRIESYWNIRSVMTERSVDTTKSEDDYAVQLREILDSSVRSHLMSEVPVGAFLSGGADSSSIVALMARGMGRPVKTYSVGFPADSNLSELEHARRAAEALGTDHHELECKEPTWDELSTIVRHLEEPIADAAVIPTFFVSRLAAQEVTVVMTGEGSDETNGGYAKYFGSENSRRWPWNALRALPPGWRKAFLNGLARKQGNLFRRVEGRVAQSLMTHDCYDFADTPLAWQAEALGIFTPDFLDHAKSKSTSPRTEDLAGSLPSLTDSFFMNDLEGWLVDDLLLKVDKMSMAHSLEARVPFLDHQYVEFALSVPWQLKLKSGSTKNLMRKALQDVVPASNLQRPQHGFTVPLGKWFRNAWRDLLRDSLDGLGSRGCFHSQALDGIFQRVVSGDDGVASLCWALVTMEIWHREFMDKNVAR